MSHCICVTMYQNSGDENWMLFSYNRQNSFHFSACLVFSNTQRDKCRFVSALSCHPSLFPHKLSIWPPCVFVLTDGMHNDLSLIPTFNSIDFASFDSQLQLISLISECAWSLTVKFLFKINQSFTLWPCCNLWGKHCGLSKFSSCRILSLTHMKNVNM